LLTLLLTVAASGEIDSGLGIGKDGVAMFFKNKKSKNLFLDFLFLKNETVSII